MFSAVSVVVSNRSIIYYINVFACFMAMQVILLVRPCKFDEFYMTFSLCLGIYICSAKMSNLPNLTIWYGLCYICTTETLKIVNINAETLY